MFRRSSCLIVVSASVCGGHAISAANWCSASPSTCDTFTSRAPHTNVLPVAKSSPSLPDSKTICKFCLCMRSAPENVTYTIKCILLC